ncbi:MAG: molybdenum cofactor guanylyltransferase [Sedimentisphaerales bacterium]|nr:molybdenum cofactor guanylyltransferase [Sedimentisphaerales bacterium]
MIKLDRMLMIGSAGINAGKTELACAILRKFGDRNNIIGIKVTTIKEKNGKCPRGGEGCGVCSSLDGVYRITEEDNSNTAKDTSRLLACGASRVFWLRVLREHLAEGVSAMLGMIGPDAVSMCESNSLRLAVRPGLFLMAKGAETKIWKDSARKVKKYADRIVVSDGKEFDLNLDEIKLVRGKWGLRKGCTSGMKNATAIVMAGGASSRMGKDKSLLPVNSRPMIEIICDQLRGQFSQVLIGANEPEKLAFLGLEIVPDRVSGQGPLMGIASSIEASSSDLNFVVACDIPHIDMAVVERLLAEAERDGADVVIPTAGTEKIEPLFAVYRKSILDAANKVLSSGRRKISDIFGLCKVKYVELSDAERLINLNTSAEYEKFIEEYRDRF